MPRPLLPLTVMLAVIGSSCGDDDAAFPDGGGASDSGGPVADAGPLPLPGRGCPTDLAPDPDVMQALPRITDFDTTYPDQAGRTIAVAAGGDLQAAIDMAMPGDTIELAADGTFTGPFTLPEKSGDGWIVIRTATPDAMLPAEGVRIRPSQDDLLPDLIAGAGPYVITTADRSHHYRLVGLEIAPAAGELVNALVSLGGGESAISELPHHIVIDRVYMRADPAEGTRRAIALNSGAAAVIDSWLEGFFQSGFDSQAIGGWSGSGPYRIINNHLEGASENIIFGGADPDITDMVPSDIEICANHITKPRAWLGMSRNVKNLFELKNARRVLVAGNVLENNWADGQVGFAVVLTPRNQDGSAPWSTIEDVTFVRNVIQATAGGINILGTDDLHPSGQQQRVVIRDNLIVVDETTNPGTGRAFQIITPGGRSPTSGLAIAHNTVRVIGNSAISMGDGTTVAVMMFLRDNVMEHATYGIFGSGVGEGNAAFMTFAPDAVVRGNVLIGYDMDRYPAMNFFPADDAELMFAAPGTDWRLAASSPFSGMATDGADPGADFDLLEEAIAGAVVPP